MKVIPQFLKVSGNSVIDYLTSWRKPLEKFVIMISGANRGIGLAIASTLFQEQNFHLSLGVRNTESIDIRKQFPDEARIHVEYYDATKPETASAWVNSTLEKFSQIDSLVNNAAILQPCGIENYDEDKLDSMWLVNTKAPITLTKHVWDHLKRSGKSRIINIVSTAGKITRPEDFGYYLTKHALLAFTHSIRQAGWQHGIRCTAICPGWVNTNMANSSEICDLAPAEMIQPAEVAKLVKTAIELPNTASVAEIVVNAQCGEFF